jgi:hypothetical protein
MSGLSRARDAFRGALEHELKARASADEAQGRYFRTYFRSAIPPVSDP